jgi:acetylornithine deacetylase/succinyl-diaminopimelate desuccinylase-like protein
MTVSHQLAYADRHAKRFVEELATLVRFPSVSSQRARYGDVRRCAHWLADHLRKIGMPSVRLVDTKKHPIVYVESDLVPNRKTVLVYGHYDVQPAEPLSEWRLPPFEPKVIGNNLYGRGSSDDKGQLLIHVKALEAFLRAGPGLPVNVKCVFDGEEEIGSPNLRSFLEANKAILASDFAVLSDTRFRGPGRPALVYSLRGSLNLELSVTNSGKELHSGAFGGAITNPIQVICDVISGLHDSAGRVTVAGFYRSVRSLSPAQRCRMANTGISDQALLRDAGVTSNSGECGYSMYERTTIRPAVVTTSISGGYQGGGIKAVIPSVASAKLNMRLVADQVPQEIEKLFRAHIRRQLPLGMSSTVKILSSGKPAVLDPRHAAFVAASIAYQRGFGVAPVLLRSGGSIPIVNLLQEVLNIPTVLMGFALPDDRMHAPNEKFHLPNFFGGIATVIHFLDLIGNPRISPEFTEGRVCVRQT